MSDFKKARIEYRKESDLHLLFWGDDPEAIYCANGPKGKEKVETLRNQLECGRQHERRGYLVL